MDPPHPQRERERGPHALSERGRRERGPLSDGEHEIRFQHGARGSIGRDGWPLTQGELEVVDRAGHPIGHGDGATMLSVTDHRDARAGHRQHVDAQGQQPVEHRRTVDVTQGVGDPGHPIRVHTLTRP